MLTLKAMLGQLARGGGKLELMSGRRPRFERRGVVENLDDEAMTDEAVVAICRAAGGGRRLETLAQGPATWTCLSEGGPVQVTAALRGREIAATFVLDEQSAKPARDERSPMREERTAIREERVSSKEERVLPRVDRRPPREDPVSVRPVRRDSVGRKALRPTPAPQPSATTPRRTRSSNPGARAVPRTEESPRVEPTIPRAVEPRPRQFQSRPPGTKAPDPHMNRAPEPRMAQPAETRPAETRQVETRHVDARPMDARPAEVRPAEPRLEVRGPKQTLRLDPLLEELIAEAQRHDASDLHLVGDLPPRARVAGELREVGRKERFTPEVVERICRPLTRDLEQALAPTGSFELAFDIRQGRARVTVSRGIRGLALSVRLLHDRPRTFAELGLPPEVAAATAHHQGLVVVTGPSGQGKSTTIAALVEHINREQPGHIITLEDPVEIPIPSRRAIVSQREIGTHATSFARALKGALRQDPDVIVVGELRDPDTVRLALSASETGHLVLGTMSTPSAASTVERILDLFPSSEQPQVRSTLAGGLRFILCQRLVPRAEGGGRVPVVELLPGSRALWNLIRENKTFQLPSLMQRGRGAGILRLDDALSELVTTGVITIDEALKVSAAPDELRELCRAIVREATRPEAENTEAPLRNLLTRAGAFFSRKGGGDD